MDLSTPPSTKSKASSIAFLGGIAASSMTSILVLVVEYKSGWFISDPGQASPQITNGISLGAILHGIFMIVSFLGVLASIVYFFAKRFDADDWGKDNSYAIKFTSGIFVNAVLAGMTFMTACLLGYLKYDWAWRDLFYAIAPAGGPFCVGFLESFDRRSPVQDH